MYLNTDSEVFSNLRNVYRIAMWICHQYLLLINIDHDV